MPPIVSAIVTAAGWSSRMGIPKPLLTWHGIPVIRYQINSLLEAGISNIVVVLGHQHELIESEVRGLGVCSIFNPNYSLGRTTSILAGLAAVDFGHHTLFIAVDQPRPTKIVRTILESHKNNDSAITMPYCDGRSGHPLIFSSLLRDELENISENKLGLREVVQTHNDEVNKVYINDPIVLLDFNEPGEYHMARKQYQA